MSDRPLSARLGATLVFATSAGVLVLEILAGRLLAPYAGVTLETFTAIIGTILAGISLGAWAGGRIADRIDPRLMLGPALVIGGALAMLTVPLVRILGPALAGSSFGLVVLVAVAALPSAAVLSSVSPAVVKASLHDLTSTGQVVGRLSAIGTAGAIVGSFLTGFVFVAQLPVSAIVLGVGAATVVAGIWLWVRYRGARGLAVTLVVAVIGAGGLLAIGGRCDVETKYYCARVEVDPDRSSGRLLWLDTLQHTYVDLDDPAHLEFRYTRLLASAIEAYSTGPIDVVHIGGGGLSMPRWVDTTRPGSTSTVLEIDPGLVQIARDELGYVDDPDIDIRVGDARTGLAGIEPGSVDVVLGDAFGGIAVPWHLTTVEVVADIEALLRPGGIYALNLIDRGAMAFARAEMATLGQVFDSVIVIAPEDNLSSGGNVVVVAGNGPLPTDELAELAAGYGLSVEVLSGEDLQRYVGDSSVLTDEFAPVDQLFDQPGAPPSV
ncbi:MAG: fused MFS/spermidine synthase [Acidimicrobiia bacterium]